MIVISSSNILFSQASRVPIKFWGIQSIGGTIGVKGEYRTQDIERRPSYSDNLKSSLMIGHLALTTKSYFYHPNLISVESQMEYNPGTQKDIYLVIPDRAEVNTGEQVRGLITFLKTQPVTFNGSANFSHLFTNREYTTDVETYNKGFSAGIRYRNTFAPLSITYHKQKTDQTELQTDRRFLTKQQNIMLNSDFSLGSLDKNRFTYTFDDYDRQYFSLVSVRSKISSFQINSNLNFDSTQTRFLNSDIYYSLSKGNFNYDRLQVNESLGLELQNNFSYIGDYQFFNFDQFKTNIKQITIRNQLEHKLFKSLRTYIYYEYINSNQTFSEEITSTGGIGINYNKKIPTGYFSFSFDFKKRNFNRDNLSPSLTVINEEHTLNNDNVVLLENPYVQKKSIVIKDVTNTIIYQENFDYIIIDRNDFIEIQRIPGGLIPEGSTVSIDYLADAQPTYEYGVDMKNFSTRLTILDNLFEIYFRFAENSYNNIFGRDPAILKSFSQRLYGSRINFNMLSVGIEFDNYNSNIVPYKSLRYFLTLNARLSNNFSVSITGNQRFFELTDENEKQKFQDFAGRLLYNINDRTSFNLETNYRFQKGRGLDLNLSVIKGELKTRYRAIYLSFGIEGYNRKYISESLKYLGTFIRIERKF